MTRLLGAALAALLLAAPAAADTTDGPLFAAGYLHELHLLQLDELTASSPRTLLVRRACGLTEKIHLHSESLLIDYVEGGHSDAKVFVRWFVMPNSDYFAAVDCIVGTVPEMQRHSARRFD